MSEKSPSIQPEDRLFHLILALMSSSYGLTKDQILGSVRGYADSDRSETSEDSLNRRFERDKDALRELGIPLEVSIPASEDVNNRFTTYRIPKGSYDLPDGVEFSPTDVALLNLSAALWREGTLSVESRVAQMKLASFGVSVSESLMVSAPVISTRDPALQKIRDAIDEGRAISFSYLKPGESQATKRSVSPWALVSHEGRWHVYAYEPASSQAKTFLLRRIVSSVSFSNVEVTPAPDRVTEEAVGALQDVYSRQRADLTITPHSEAWSVLAARPDSNVEGTQVMVHYTDLAIFADEITSYGHDVVVNGPPELRERVTRNLAELVGRHGR